jgi:hypothetical protein
MKYNCFLEVVGEGYDKDSALADAMEKLKDNPEEYLTGMGEIVTEKDREEREKKEILEYCFQPEFAGEGNVTGHPEAIVFSWWVWAKESNLLKDLPNCKPIRYAVGDIEEPTYMDLDQC